MKRRKDKDEPYFKNEKLDLIHLKGYYLTVITINAQQVLESLRDELLTPFQDIAFKLEEDIRIPITFWSFVRNENFELGKDEFLSHILLSEDKGEAWELAKAFHQKIYSWSKRWFLNEDYLLSCVLLTLVDWSKLYKPILTLDPNPKPFIRPKSDVDEVSKLKLMITVLPKREPPLIGFTHAVRSGTLPFDEELDENFTFNAQWYPLEENDKSFKKRCLANFKQWLNEYIKKQSKAYSGKYKSSKGRKLENEHCEWLLRWNIEKWTKAQIADFYKTTKDNIEKTFKKMKALGFPVRDGRL